MTQQEYITFHHNLLDTYITDVLNNNIIVCKQIKLAVRRYNTLKEKYTFNQTSFNNVLSFFSLLQINDKQFILAGFQVFALAILYGLWNNQTNMKLIKTMFIHIARKNSKSFFSILLSLYELYHTKNSENHVISGNLTLAQHNLNDLKVLILTNPILRKSLKMLYNTVELRTKDSKSMFKIFALKDKNINSFKATIACIDEAALISDEVGNKIYSLFLSGQVGLKNATVFILSSSDFSKDNFHYSQYLYSKRLLNDDEENDSYFPLIYEQDNEDEINQPETWCKSNPGINNFVDINILKQLYLNAGSIPSQLQYFACKNLNYWIDDYTEWIPSDIIKSTFTELSINDFSGKTCYLGLDLSNTLDLTCISQLFFVNNRIYTFQYFFMVNNPANFKRKSGFNFKEAEKRGEITIFNKTVMDKEYIYEFILELDKKNKIEKIGYDKAYSTDLINRLDQEFKCEAVPQKYIYLNVATNQLIEWIYNNQITHNLNKTMIWNYQNVVIGELEGMKKIVKNKSADSVDGPVSLVTAIKVFLDDFSNLIFMNSYLSKLNSYSSGYNNQ